MEKLQWFKFSPYDWKMGKIQRCTEITQIRFINLCGLYWNKETNLTLEDATIEIDQEYIDILLSKKIISHDGENISIDFLDEQYDKILETSKQASKAGKASAEKRKAIAQQKLNDRSTTVQQNPTDKIRREEIREEDNKEFDLFWNLYNKKTGKDKCIKKWNKLSEKERSLILESLPKYIKSKPEIQYRLNPLTYLNGKHWEDEIQEPQDNGGEIRNFYTPEQIANYGKGM